MTFEETITAAYKFDEPSIDLARPLRDGSPRTDLPIRVPLRMMNRHGLIAGSTGTGKTRTLQLMVEGLSQYGVPTFVSDIKGDLAGLAKPGEASGKVVERAWVRIESPLCTGCDVCAKACAHGAMVAA